MIHERFSSPNLRKTISEPKTEIERNHVCLYLHVRFPSVLVAQWFERFTGHQKATGSIPVWDLEIVFLSRIDERLSII